MRPVIATLWLFHAFLAVGQGHDRFTLYREENGKPFRIREGRLITIAVEPTRCSGWEVRDASVDGDLLLVDDAGVTIMLRSEHVACYDGDSTFTWDRSDCPDGGTLTIPNERILAIIRERPSGIAFNAVLGLAAFTTVFVAPLASVKWFNGWDFNPDTYTTITKGGLIAIGASLPLALVFGSERRLLPPGHRR